MLDILDDKALTVIFANIEDLLLTATSFLSELEQRQKACRLYVDVIGDILEEHIGRMRVYMVSGAGTWPFSNSLFPQMLIIRRIA